MRLQARPPGRPGPVSPSLTIALGNRPATATCTALTRVARAVTPPRQRLSTEDLRHGCGSVSSLSSASTAAASACTSSGLSISAAWQTARVTADLRAAAWSDGLLFLHSGYCGALAFAACPPDFAFILSPFVPVSLRGPRLFPASLCSSRGDVRFPALYCCLLSRLRCFPASVLYVLLAARARARCSAVYVARLPPVCARLAAGPSLCFAVSMLDVPLRAVPFSFALSLRDAATRGHGAECAGPAPAAAPWRCLRRCSRCPAGPVRGAHVCLLLGGRSPARAAGARLPFPPPSLRGRSASGRPAPAGSGGAAARRAVVGGVGDTLPVTPSRPPALGALPCAASALRAFWVGSSALAAAALPFFPAYCRFVWHWSAAHGPSAADRAFLRSFTRRLFLVTGLGGWARMVTPRAWRGYFHIAHPRSGTTVRGTAAPRCHLGCTAPRFQRGGSVARSARRRAPGSRHVGTRAGAPRGRLPCPAHPVARTVSSCVRAVRCSHRSSSGPVRAVTCLSASRALHPSVAGRAADSSAGQSFRSVEIRCRAHCHARPRPGSGTARSLSVCVSPLPLRAS